MRYDPLDGDRLLTPGEVAALWRVDPKTITRWAAAGLLPAMKLEHTVVTCDQAACTVQVIHRGPAGEVDGWLRERGWLVGLRQRCPGHEAPIRVAIPAPRQPVEEDADIRALAAAGDREAFAALADQYYAQVYRYLRRRCGQHQLAEDLTQDTFARALRHVGSYTEMGRAFGAWLMRIAGNLLIDHYKSAWNRYMRVVDFAAVDVGAASRLVDDADPAEEAAAADTARLLRAAMQDLTDGQRTVLELRFFDGLSVEETAARMGLAAGAAKAIQWRAVRALASHESLATLAPSAVAA